MIVSTILDQHCGCKIMIIYELSNRLPPTLNVWTTNDFIVNLKVKSFNNVMSFSQGGHKPGKHGKPGKLREFEKLSKSQGKLREI